MQKAAVLLGYGWRGLDTLPIEADSHIRGARLVDPRAGVGVQVDYTSVHMDKIGGV